MAQSPFVLPKSVYRLAGRLAALALGAGALGMTWSAMVELSAAPAPGGDPSNWESYLGPTGDSKSRETGILTEWPADGPPLVWVLGVGEGYSAPAVSDGRLFHFDRVDDRARLTALDARSGREIWQQTYATDYEDYYDYSNGPRTSPVVDGDRIYTFGVEGRLRCHRIEDGTLLWDVDTTADFGVVKNFFGVGSTPVVYGDLLITMVGGSPEGSPKIHSGEVRGNGSAIVAFDKKSGEVVYRFSDELASYSTPKLARIGGRDWAFAFTRGGLLAFEPASGREEFFFPWRAKVLESVNAATPVVDRDTVFITETYGPGSALVRVKPGGYDVVWQDPKRGQALQAHWNTPVLLDGVLYASSGRNTGNAELRAVRMADGEVLWSQPGLGRASVLSVDGHLVVLSEGGELRLVESSPTEYRERAKVDLSKVDAPADPAVALGASGPLLRAPAWNAPVLAEGLLYLRGKDTLVALELIPRN